MDTEFRKFVSISLLIWARRRLVAAALVFFRNSILTLLNFLEPILKSLEFEFQGHHVDGYHLKHHKVCEFHHLVKCLFSNLISIQTLMFQHDYFISRTSTRNTFGSTTTVTTTVIMGKKVCTI